MPKSQQTHRGAISTSNHLATAAGVAALEKGGNAIDAALAAVATLCVVYPNNVALGGDLVALVRQPNDRLLILNATGTAPKNQTLQSLQEKHGKALPLRGVDTITIPGAIRGWEELHNLGATLDWEEHFDDAIMYAEAGVPIAKSVAGTLVLDQESFSQDPGGRSIFYPNGIPLAEGEVVKQPALADTLRKLARNGADEFYSGQVAESWVAGLAKFGSKITVEDAQNYQASWVQPLTCEFAGHTIVTSPPSTSGFMLLRALNAIAEGIVDPLGTGSGELAAAFDEANCIRAKYLSDPSFTEISGEELIHMNSSPRVPNRDRQATGDTVGLSAVSADGWAISLIDSIFWGFGSHILEANTGVIFQNRGSAFSLDPASPNVFEAGKRPRHTLMPVMVLRGDELAWISAAMGGAGQPQIHTQLILRLLSGATPSTATHAPRWMVGELQGDERITVTVEDDVDDDVKSQLIATGFDIQVVPKYTETLGHANLISVSGSRYDAASDPRSDGSAAVVPLD